jgi:hypothetical protein
VVISRRNSRKPGSAGIQPEFGEQRFAGDQGDFGAVGGEEGFDGGAVVPFGDEDVVVEELSFADGFGMAERQLGAEAVADEGFVAPAMIVAFEFEVFGRPVAARARRRARLTTSVPAFEKATRSAQGRMAVRRSATRYSSSCWAPKVRPLAALAAMAAATAGGAWPRMSGPQARP